MPIDDRTSTQNYPKPNIANTLADDVGRLRTALDDIDTGMASKAPAASPVFTGTAGIPLGSASAPSLYFTGDPNTGLYSPGADQVAITTGGTGRLFVDASGNVGVGVASDGARFLAYGDGTSTATAKIVNPSSTNGAYLYLGDSVADAAIKTIPAAGTGTSLGFYVNSASAERLRITSDGKVGVGTSSPGAALEVVGAPPEIIIRSTTSSDGFIRFTNTSGSMSAGMGGAADNIYQITDRTNSHVAYQYRGGVSGYHLWSVNNTERARIDSSGRLLVGTSAARSNFYNTSFANRLQIEGTDSATTTLSLTSNNSSAVGQEGTLVFAKSNSDSGGSNVLVSTGTPLGRLSFQGSDGSEFVEAGSIRGEVDGTPAANDMPGRLVFSTTADGAATPTERMRIDSAGVLQIADAGNIAVGTTTGTKIGTATTQKLGFFNKTPVVQPTAVANATDAASVITQLNALLARMRDLGLIAT